MKTRKLQVGLTLVEILMAAAIVAVLAGIVLTVLTRIDSQAKEHLCQGTLETLNTALRQFRDYDYQYRINATGDELVFYRNLKFPPDCNGYSEVDVEFEIEKLIDPASALTVDITPNNKHDPNESGITVMYFYLNMVPQCRETLAGIDQSLLKSDHNGDQDYLTIIIGPVTDNRIHPWIRVVDPWGTPLKYDYYANENKEDLTLTWKQRKETIRNFPLITSAGPDKEFDTTDDITNRDKTKPAEYTP